MPIVPKKLIVHKKSICAAWTILLILAFPFFSCANNETPVERERRELLSLLENPQLDSGSRYAIVNQIANGMLSADEPQTLILFLTDWVQKNPSDMYNAYWLLMTAYAYLSDGAEPFSEYYMGRILRQYSDLRVRGRSVHFLCLLNLIKISRTPANRILYLNELINRFPQDVNVTELYLRRALEYEKTGEWESALRSFTLFLEQPDAATIQIAGEPNAYNEARQLVAFNNSSKDWTYETLDALVAAVKTAIRNYDWRTLDRYRSKVNFFSMAWNQDVGDAGEQQEFSMRRYMTGQRISYSETVERGLTPNEAYLRTSGWSPYNPVWYLYFRKVNFPIDPDIHGNWEWAGIYMGERL